MAAGLARQNPSPIFCCSAKPTEAKTRSEPKVRTVRAASTCSGVSSGSGGPPSTVPMSPAYSRDSEVAFVMPLPPGTSAACQAGRFIQTRSRNAPPMLRARASSVDA